MSSDKKLATYEETLPALSTLVTELKAASLSKENPPSKEDQLFIKFSERLIAHIQERKTPYEPGKEAALHSLMRHLLLANREGVKFSTVLDDWKSAQTGHYHVLKTHSDDRGLKSIFNPLRSTSVAKLINEYSNPNIQPKLKNDLMDPNDRKQAGPKK